MNEPIAMRSGEELNGVTLEPYLRARLFAGPGFSMSQFPSGFSNLTYAIDLGEQELVLRRPPFGANVKGGHNMAREFRILTGLARGYGKAPRPVLLCEDESIAGAPFYLMERVPGRVLRANGTGPIDAVSMRQFSSALIDTLAELHSLDYVALGLGDLGNPAEFVARQVTGWGRRLEASVTEELPDMTQCVAWLADNVPYSANAPTLIHNDFKYDNVMFDEKRLGAVCAVLDWEMATIGDPLMDLGTTLGYWSQPDDPEVLRSFNLTCRDGNLDRNQVVDRYALVTGRDVRHILYYFVFGLFKIGVIVQQIYARYRRGDTKDARFASLIQLERALARQAVLLIDAGKIR